MRANHLLDLWSVLTADVAVQGEQEGLGLGVPAVLGEVEPAGVSQREVFVTVARTQEEGMEVSVAGVLGVTSSSENSGLQE